MTEPARHISEISSRYHTAIQKGVTRFYFPNDYAIPAKWAQKRHQKDRHQFDDEQDDEHNLRLFRGTRSLFSGECSPAAEAECADYDADAGDRDLQRDSTK